MSVVVPAYNCADVIDVQLGALAAQSYDGEWEVIVVDNGSTDGTGDRARAWVNRVPGLRVIEAGERQGVSYARNRGIESSQGELIAICDADDRVEPQWLAALVEKCDEFDVVAGWCDPGPLNDVVTQSWRWVPPRDRLVPHLDFLPFAHCGNVAIRRSCLDEIGLFRDDFTAGGDDIEFSWRAQMRGYKLGLAADAVSQYRFRSTLRAHIRQYRGYGRADPLLYREFGRHGMPGSGLGAAARAWSRLLARAPIAAVDRRRRGLWAGNVAQRWGRVIGSFQHRRLYL